jgi:hypothetical protein
MMKIFGSWTCIFFLSAQRFGRQAANTACRKLWKAKENKETGTKFTRRSRSGTSETKPKKNRKEHFPDEKNQEK